MSISGFFFIPLIEFLDDCFTVQKWYPGVSNGVRSLDNFKKFFESLMKHGTVLGYHLIKCHMFTEELLFEKTQKIFVNDEEEIFDGCRVLGSVKGSDKAEKSS